jgi:hypothetical protein
MAVPAVVNMPFIKLPQGSRLPEDFGLIRRPPAFPNPAAGTPPRLFRVSRFTATHAARCWPWQSPDWAA